MQLICNMTTSSFINELKQTGFKLTGSRKEILSVLSNNPLSPQEVWKALVKKGFSLDLVTVYRTLELFGNLGLVSKIQFEDKFSRYELTNNHHHHLVCIKCGVVEDIIINEETLILKIGKQSDFEVQRHALEFFGLCRRCK